MGMSENEVSTLGLFWGDFGLLPSPMKNRPPQSNKHLEEYLVLGCEASP